MRSKAGRRRIFSAQGLYAAGAGRCIIGTYANIAFIVRVQPNYTRMPGFSSRAR